MANKFDVPDEAGMERLLISVYENLPVADIARLNRIEERLSRKLVLKKPERKASTLPWWVILLLAGGFATAAWWTGEKFFGQPDDQINNIDKLYKKVVPENDPGISSTNPDASRNSENNQESHRDRKSTIIYQRESF